MSKIASTMIFEKNYYENSAWKNKRVICGIDEVGRSCLAGPLVTAAVILPCRKDFHLLKDSKKLSLQERNTAYNWIQKNCWYATALVDHRTIDQKNIYQATLAAMKRAVLHCLIKSPQRPSAFVVDAMPLSLANTNYKDTPIHFFNKGEDFSTSIAAAFTTVGMCGQRTVFQS